MKKRTRIMAWVLSAVIGISAATGLSSVNSFAATEEGSDRIIVSLGDSYSSGEGIPHFYNYDLP